MSSSRLTSETIGVVFGLSAAPVTDTAPEAHTLEFRMTNHELLAELRGLEVPRRTFTAQDLRIAEREDRQIRRTRKGTVR